MATTMLQLRVRVAWWVRPVLAVVFLIAAVCPARVGRAIDAIVDHGIKVEAKF